MPRKTTSTPQTKPAKTRAFRPEKGSLARALDEANSFRPEHVPYGATLLVAWVNLPGENTQRSKHWAVNAAWKDALKKDFLACLDFQGHPGMYQTPAVHIAMHVSRKGDDNNLLSRAKYVIDLLQTYKQNVAGKRVQGLLDLIEQDDVLNAENRSIEEMAVKTVVTDKVDKYGRFIKIAPYKVIVWVWEQE